MRHMTLGKLARNFINLIYPLRCETCKVELDPSDAMGVCHSCLDDIRLNPKPFCPSCGRSVHNAGRICHECEKTELFFFKNAYSCCLYEGTLKELIHSFKYKGKVSLANIFSIIMVDFISENMGIAEGVDYITYVPMQLNRMLRRDYNQSRVMAQHLSKELGMPMLDTLRKARNTRPQNELSREERLSNLNGAFKARTNIDIKDRSILLIDDVMTTGTTLSECAKALLVAGAKSVKCLTLARGA